MNDCRQEWYDAAAKVKVTVVDATDASQKLVNAHLCGPVAGYYLSKALCGAALLGAELSESDETLVVQMKCSGPLGGFNVECTAAGTLRGYVEKKTLDDFDGLVRQPISRADGKKIVGEARIQVTRTVPGRILSQGVSNSFDGYLAGSLQRKAVMFTDARTSDEAEVLYARGVMVECLPDAPGTEALSADFGDISVSPRRILARAGLSGAELRRTAPISFACRCSPERAAATIAALGESDRAGLPPVLDVTCHMCGRTYSISTAT